MTRLARLTILAILLLNACSSQIPGYESLANQGILPLSTTNPYLATNLLLAQEAQKSDYLYNFLKFRGGPTAIEVHESRTGPVKIIMFYPKDKEVYAADIVSKQNMHEWMVRGPFQIERQDYRALAELDHAMAGEPIFVMNGKIERFRFEQTAPTRVLNPKVPPTPVPTPRPAKKIVVKPTVKPEDQVPTDFSKMNSDQMALYMAKGFAERNTSGDLIHTVMVENETLAAIAKWYTKSESNAAAIASASGLAIDKALEKGARVKVPATLVKEAKQMPITSAH